MGYVLIILAQGIRGVFYLLLPLTAISFFVVLIFVKKISLKRADDAEKKVEGKQWVEDRKNKRRGKKNVDVNHQVKEESKSDEKINQSEGLGEKIERKVMKEEKALEQAAEVFDEGAGVTPANPTEDIGRR